MSSENFAASLRHQIANENDPETRAKLVRTYRKVLQTEGDEVPLAPRVKGDPPEFKTPGLQQFVAAHSSAFYAAEWMLSREYTFFAEAIDNDDGTTSARLHCPFDKDVTADAPPLIVSDCDDDTLTPFKVECSHTCCAGKDRTLADYLDALLVQDGCPHAAELLEFTTYTPEERTQADKRLRRRRIVYLADLDDPDDVADELQAQQIRDRRGRVTGQGPVIADRMNYRRALHKLGMSVRFNEFSDKIEVFGVPGHGGRMNDRAYNRIRVLLEDECGLEYNDAKFKTYTEDTADRCRFHPVRDYLDSRREKWDGVPRVERLFTHYFMAEADPDTPRHAEYLAATARCWLVAAVARIYSPGVKFDELPVMLGPQGQSKSSAVRMLAVDDRWFSDSLTLSADPKHVMELTKGKWILEIAELGGYTKKEADHTKALLSRSTDQARAAYARYAEENPRSFVLFSTANETEFLKDHTGNRRYWPVKCGGVRADELLADRDQIWAEAVAMFDGGVSIRLDPTLWNVAAAVQTAHALENPFVTTLAPILAKFDHHNVAPAELFKVLGISIDRANNQHHSNTLKSAMAALGWEYKPTKLAGGATARVFQRRNPDKSEKGQPGFDRVRTLQAVQTDTSDRGRVWTLAPIYADRTDDDDDSNPLAKYIKPRAWMAPHAAE